MAILNNSNAISTAGGYDISNSLRIRGIDASAYLNRTPASAGNRRTWTYSAWIKRGNITPAAGGQSIFYAGSSTSSPRGGIVFGNSGSDNKLSFNGMLYNSTTQVLGLETSAEFRDPSAWYHIVVVLDTTQATSSNRAKIYVNGSQVTAFGTATYPSLNQELQYNDAILHATRHPSGDYEYDGYLAEVNFIDGQALTPSSFGETDTTTGSWKPKAYTGTFGTNGFYLKFSDIATTSGSNAGLGKDFSGNTNYWTTNNISVTAGTTYDAMSDVPTLTSATVANYAVMNPLWTDGSVVIAQGNLNVSGGNYGGFSTLTIPTSSKFYAEFTVTATQGNQGVGILKAANAYSGVISQADMFGSNSVTYYSVNGNKFVLGGGSTAYGSSWGTIGDVIGIAVNTVDNQITFYKNNTSQGVITGLTSGIEWVFATGNQTSTGGGAWNFGQRPFSYTPPTGFVALNTFNLPSSTIPKGNTVMDATLYTGNGTSQTITTASSFKPDLVWIKGRSYADFHTMFDTVRGATKSISSNLTTAEVTRGNALTAFTSTGFTVGYDTLVNYNGQTTVAWQWQAGQGSSSSNTSGNVTSTVSVNANAGFSVVTYTVTTTVGMTIGHGLGAVPKMIMEKRYDSGSTANWDVYHVSLGNTGRLLLNTTDSFNTQAGVWNNTTPTSTVFSQQGNGNWHAVGATCVAYCWAAIPGFSAFGSYEGNASSDGPMIYLGFRPKFVLIKRSSVAGNDWVIRDSSRDTYNTTNLNLYANLSDAEASGSVNIDFLSNGFKLRGSGVGANGSGTYIYMAFAENPFKNSLAR